ncbi:MAG: YfhO family protein [Anaerolineae bacterium]
MSDSGRPDLHKGNAGGLSCLLALNGMANRWRDWVSLFVLLLCVSVFYWSGLRPGYTFLPVDLANTNLPWQASTGQPLQNWLISDSLYQFYPFLEHSVSTIRQEHIWPLWDSDIFTGHPSYADPLYQTFYPVFTILGLILDAARGFAIGLWLHALLAAWFTYGLLRSLACTRPASVLGALTYALSGYMVTWFETPFWLCTLAWLPAIMWAFEVSIQRRNLAHVALASIALGLATLAGQFSFVAVFGLFLFLYACARALELVREHARLWFWPLLALPVIALIGSLLSAVQVIPFAEFLNLSRRTSMQMSYDPLPLKQLITLILPNFFGNPSLPSAYWGTGNYSEDVIYGGIVALFLAVIYIVQPGKLKTAKFSIITLLMLLLILGAPGVLLLGRIPFFQYISLHRTVFILPLCLALLAAKTLGVARVPLWSVAVAVGGIVISAVVAIYANLAPTQENWPLVGRGIALQAGLLAVATALIILRGRWLCSDLSDAGLIVLVFIDLFLAGHNYNPSGPIARLLTPTSAVKSVQQVLGSERAIVLQRDDILFGPNVLSLYGIAEGGGYSSLLMARYYALVAAGDPQIDIGWASRQGNMVLLSRPTERLLDLLGVRYVFSRTALTDVGITLEHQADYTQLDTGEITAAHPLTGSFIVRNSALNRLDLRFRVYPYQQARGTLVLRLWRGTEPARLIVEERVNSDGLVDGQVATFYFEPDKLAPGMEYRWELSVESNTGRSGVALYTSDTGVPSLSAYGVTWAQVYQGETFVAERLAALPRAYIVYAAETITDDALVTARLLHTDFDLRNTAVSSDNLPLPSVSALPATPAQITAYTSTAVTIQAHARQDGLLVLSDQYYPGWRAFVDGKSAEIVRVNQIMRGVLLPAGEHQVVFRFQPDSLRLGVWLSLVGLLLCIGLCGLGRRLDQTLRKKKK